MATFTRISRRNRGFGWRFRSICDNRSYFNEFFDDRFFHGRNDGELGRRWTRVCRRFDVSGL
jgi:hypothetical protein